MVILGLSLNLSRDVLMLLLLKIFPWELFANSLKVLPAPSDPFPLTHWALLARIVNQIYMVILAFLPSVQTRVGLAQSLAQQWRSVEQFSLFGFLLLEKLGHILDGILDLVASRKASMLAFLWHLSCLGAQLSASGYLDLACLQNPVPGTREAGK